MLEFQDVSFSFEKGKRVLKNITFSVREGELLCLAGPNGSGKTVLMKHCNGLLKPDEGRVLFHGKEADKQLSLLRQKVGIVFQNSDAQFVGQTVREDIAFGPENLGWPPEKVKETVTESCNIMGVSLIQDEQPHFLSGGEKKRVAIAGIIAMDPDVIILDEPFAGLDYQGVCAVTKEIIHLKERGHTLIIITHDLEKILAYVDRLIILNKGAIVYDGGAVIDQELFTKNNIRVPFGWGRSVESCTWL